MTAAEPEPTTTETSTTGGPCPTCGRATGDLASAISIQPAYTTSQIGRLPILRFKFAAADDAGNSIEFPPVNLMMDATSLRKVRQVLAAAIDSAILSARRGRPTSRPPRPPR
jgi:hypothetical protein